MITHFNDYSEITHCIPQKLHRNLNAAFDVTPEMLRKTERDIKPYHCILLLQVNSSNKLFSTESKTQSC